MNVLVTGSTGFVGSHLCQKLSAAGHQVRAFHRAASQMRGLEGLPVEHVIGDLTTPDSLYPALDGVEVVFHTAAWMGGNEQTGRRYTVTVEGTRSLLKAALKCGVRRVVHTSSAAAFGIPDQKNANPPLLLNEHHTWNYRADNYPYGYAKYLAELEVQKAVAAGQDAVIVNPTLIFGPGDLYRQSSSLITQVAEQRIPAAVKGGINCVSIEDVVEGHLAALEYGKTGERYILGGENLTFFQLLSLIANVVGRPEPSLMIPDRLVNALAGPLRMFQPFFTLPVSPELLHLVGYTFFYDTRKAQEELHLAPPRPVRDAIQDAYTWFQTI